MSSTIDPMNLCRHAPRYHMRLLFNFWLESQFALIHNVIDLIVRPSALIRSSAEAASGHIRHCICMSSTVDRMNICSHALRYHMRLMFDFWLEPQFALIHTMIDLIWRPSALIRFSAEATSGHIRHCICMSSTVDPMNICRHALRYHMLLSFDVWRLTWTAICTHTNCDRLDMAVRSSH